MEDRIDVETLTEIAFNKLTLLEDVLKLTKEQNDALEQEDYGRLEVLLARRQAKLNEVDKLDKQFKLYSSRLKSLLGINPLEDWCSLNLPGTNELKAAITKGYGLMGKIKAESDANQTVLSERLEEVRGILKSAKQQKYINHAYFQEIPTTSSMYFDTKK